jgi:hypothetical protein
MMDYLIMSLESTVSVAKVGTNSVRATVPEGIVAFLDLKVGDKLVWKMDIRNSERMAIVTKKVDNDSVEQTERTKNAEVDSYSRPKRVKKIGRIQ